MSQPPQQQIKLGTAGDLPFIDALQGKHTYELGFLHRYTLRARLQSGQILLGQENEENAGFLHYGSMRGPELRIFQAAVCTDARRRHLGLGMLRELESIARDQGVRGISLRCLEDLESNEFWKQAGFACNAVEPGRKGMLNVWTKALDPAFDQFHSRWHRCRKCGNWTVDVWTAGAKRWSLCQECLWVP
jgi:hypothetical protein